MRGTLLWGFVSLLLLAGPGCKQAKEKPPVKPPLSAQQTLLTLYPRANPDSARWEWDTDGYFEAHFRLDGLPHKFRTDSTGRYLETEINVARRSLPPPVQDTLQAQIDRAHDASIFRVRQVSVIHFADGHTEYEAQVRAAGKWRKRYYDDKGKQLREILPKKG
ncbi:MAG: hypothetical protein H7330_15030 [Hymenobacteraceae bacterium]|nr:hypothetical protein [Hymenobacteraceae bacterium]